jgi:polyhydroxybutyrate depolymerase
LPRAAEAQLLSCNGRSLTDRGTITPSETPQTASGSVSPSSGDVYPFHLDAPRECTFTFCPPGTSNYDPWLCLMDASGVLLDQNDDFCNLGSQVVRVLNPGDYAIAVSGFSSSAGSYTLAYSCGDPGPYVVGGSRPVAIRVPAGYDPSVPAPLLLLLHGVSQSPDFINPYLRFAPVADERGLLLALPRGTYDRMGRAVWNATDACCAGASDREIDDSGYLRGVIAEIQGLLNVDPDRIYFVGHSNGGFMSYRMACDHADLVAAIASLAGATFADPAACQPEVPVHVLQVHGTADTVIPYGGGIGVLTGRPYPGAVATVEQWARTNGCDLVVESAPNLDLDGVLPGAETTVAQYTSGCSGGGSAELWTIANGEHSPSFRAVGESTSFAVHVVDWLLAHTKRPGPRVDFSILPALGPAPHTVQVDASASTPPEGTSIASYHWDFGDGATEVEVTAEHTYAEPGRYFIGLSVVTADGRAGSKVSVTTATCPGGDLAPWTAADIGEPAYPGSARFEPDGALELCVGGLTAEIGAESLLFVHQEASGDFQIIAQVAELPPGRIGEVGVLLRGGLDADAPFAGLAIRPRAGFGGPSARFFVRDLPGASVRLVAEASLDVPGGWVQLARSGDVIQSLISADGKAWTPIAEETVALGERCLAGVAASADDSRPGEPYQPLRVRVTDLEATPVEPRRAFVRGDCNDDGDVSGSVSDAVFLLQFNFTGGAAPPCLAACDANGDGAVLGEVTDAVYTLRFNFLGGPAPPAPFPGCGNLERPSDEALGCEAGPEACL